MLNAVTVLSATGDITLPEEVQATLGLHGGSRLAVSLEGGRIVLQPLLTETLEQLMGIFRSDRDLVAELQEERRQDRW